MNEVIFIFLKTTEDFYETRHVGVETFNNEYLRQ